MVFYTWGNLYFVASEVSEHFYRWNSGFDESENNSRRPVRGNKEKVLYYSILQKFLVPYYNVAMTMSCMHSTGRHSMPIRANAYWGVLRNVRITLCRPVECIQKTALQETFVYTIVCHIYNMWVSLNLSFLSMFLLCTGIAVGHIYFFLEDVFPQQHGGFKILRTPGILWVYKTNNESVFAFQNWHLPKA